MISQCYSFFHSKILNLLCVSGNFILQDNEAKSEITFGKNKISKNKEWNKSALDVSSVPMITVVKEIFDKITQYGSRRNENPKTEFEQQQNFFSSSKFKRALSTFENEEMYELQLKIPLDINLTALELRRELLLALKKFVIFTSLHEGRPPINEDAVRIKVIFNFPPYFLKIYLVALFSRTRKYQNLK